MRRVVVAPGGADGLALAAGLSERASGWQIVRTDGGDEALAACDREAVDAAVIDAKAPPAGGIDLLRRLEAGHPEVLRLLRFESSDPGAAISALRTVHQMVPGSCEPAVVVRLIDRLCDFRRYLADDRIRSKLGAAHELPVRSSLHTKIRLKIDDADVGAADMAQLLREDPALSSRVLQLANSPLFGARQPIVTIRGAISHLGLNTLKNLVLVEELFIHARGMGRDHGFPYRRFHRHALLTAQIARSIMVGVGSHEDAFVGGMLHDFGRLILHVTGLGEDDVPSPAAGGYVLGTWGVPPGLAEIVAFHREPWRVEPEDFGVVGAVHLAGLLAGHLDAEGREGAWSPLPERTLEHLRRVGADDDLAGWRELVARVGFDLRAARRRSRR